MKITIVMGFFLPMPPKLGGATEKTWHRLAVEFAARGHEVTVVSRRWQAMPKEEMLDGVRHVRLPGFDHTRQLSRNLTLDLIWSARVHSRLPAADIVVVNAVTLPMWLGRVRPAAGRVVVMPGRMPKGQYRFYRNIARILATSTPVCHRVVEENPALARVTRVVGYPIAYDELAAPRPAGALSQPVTIGYAGRLHPEKGLDLLVDAAAELQADATLPPWRLLMRGPHTVASGGGGENYRAGLEAKLRRTLPANRWNVDGPLFDDGTLAAFYRSLDVFCYPSLAAGGETFGVAIVEAMAAGAAPIVSDLACFRDFVRPGVNGLVFDHKGPDAARRLTEAIASLVRDAAQRRSLATAAQTTARDYNFASYTERLLADFATLDSEHDGGGASAASTEPMLGTRI